MRRNTKKILARLTLSGLSVLILLIAMEIVLRGVLYVDHRNGGTLEQQLNRSKHTNISDIHGEFSLAGLIEPSLHHDIVYELKPGLTGTFKGAPVQVNPFGMRDRDYTVEKPEGTYRIAGLGDSIMFGWRVEQDDMYLKVLERQLNALPDDPRNFEVMNFAVPGYNTAMEVEVFAKKALQFDPDLVVIQFVSNDAGAPMLMQRAPNYLALNKSYLFESIQQRTGWFVDFEDVNQNHESLKRDKDMKKWDDDGEERAKVLSRYNHLVGSSGVSDAFERLGEMCGERGIPVIVLSGKFYKGQRRLVERACRANRFSHVNVAPYSDAYLAEHGIPDDKQAIRNVLWVAAGDSHPSKAAHTIYAGALMDMLGAMGIVDYEPVLPDALWLPPAAHR